MFTKKFSFVFVALIFMSCGTMFSQVAMGVAPDYTLSPARSAAANASVLLLEQSQGNLVLREVLVRNCTAPMTAIGYVQYSMDGRSWNNLYPKTLPIGEPGGVLLDLGTVNSSKPVVVVKTFVPPNGRLDVGYYRVSIPGLVSGSGSASCNIGTDANPLAFTETPMLYIGNPQASISVASGPMRVTLLQEIGQSVVVGSTQDIVVPNLTLMHVVLPSSFSAYVPTLAHLLDLSTGVSMVVQVSNP